MGNPYVEEAVEARRDVFGGNVEGVSGSLLSLPLVSGRNLESRHLGDLKDKREQQNAGSLAFHTIDTDMQL